MKTKIIIKAIACGVDKNVIGKLKIGNGYCLKKQNLFYELFLNEFGINMMTAIREYLEDIIDNKDNIILIHKEYDDNMEEEFPEYFDKIEKRETSYLDDKMRMIRLYSNNSFNIKSVHICIKTMYDNTWVTSCNSVFPFSDKIYDRQYIPKLSIKS